MAATDTPPKGPKPDKIIRDALMAAIRQSPEKLKRGAEKLVEKLEDGDDPTWRFFADRIDGKAVQPISGDDESPLTIIQRIERVVVDANATNKDS